ncbi:OmpA family protein [Heyndrickxia sporothermodurans]|uniref:OmpA/MotB family protein n=1 Tax=Heyndrickxia sporothermodurans TaxID=46224 RepID=UPI002DB6D4E2|nr:OmpA family protein [Heyndrickxia sporothermodurans]MEB6548984.1 OmpA family protein [Heyndrickxia sporothermodurans]
MARGMRNTRRQYLSGHEEEKESYWVSYTDLMSGLVIILALVLMVAIFDMQGAYEEAEASVKQKEETIQKQNKMIEEVVGVKAKIIDELVRAFKDSNLALQVDKQTGTIKFSGGVLFKSNSTEISDGGKQYLKEFIPKYIGVLLSKQFKDQISQIIIEGHTNKVGDYLFNLNLSQGRALSVVEEIYSKDFPKFPQKTELSKIITANGRSHSVPIYNKKGKIDAEKSRRVEFKFRLKDDQVLDKIQKMVDKKDE